MSLVTDGGEVVRFFLVTAAPFSHGGRMLVTLVIEDITEFMELREIVPICASCKKIRQDDEYWHTVEKYIETHMDLKFSHGLCPACAAKMMEELK